MSSPTLRARSSRSPRSGPPLAGAVRRAVMEQNPSPVGGPRRIVHRLPRHRTGTQLRPVVPLHPQQTFAAANSNRLHVSHALPVDDSLAASRVLAMEISERSARARVHIGADPDILVVEDVARILRCTADTARRIPRDQLRSISGPGRRQLYLREDVIAYVRSRARHSPNAGLLLAQARATVLELPADRVRGRSQRRRTS
jgi:hypothetical protein